MVMGHTATEHFILLLSILLLFRPHPLASTPSVNTAVFSAGYRHIILSEAAGTINYDSKKDSTAESIRAWLIEPREHDYHRASARKGWTGFWEIMSALQSWKKGRLLAPRLISLRIHTLSMPTAHGECPADCRLQIGNAGMPGPQHSVAYCGVLQNVELRLQASRVYVQLHLPNLRILRTNPIRFHITYNIIAAAPHHSRLPGLRISPFWEACRPFFYGSIAEVQSIRRKQVCNGITDCPGGEDELPLLCNRQTHLLKLIARLLDKSNASYPADTPSVTSTTFQPEPTTVSSPPPVFPQKLLKDHDVEILLHLKDIFVELTGQLHIGFQPTTEIWHDISSSTVNGSVSEVNATAEVVNSTSSANVCDQNEYSCATVEDDSSCISRAWICDGSPDCPEGEDEAEKICQKFMPPGSSEAEACPFGKFACPRDARCLPKKFVCDGYQDCFDNHDESKLACEWKTRNDTTMAPMHSSGCPEEEPFPCHPLGKCLPLKFICDGIVHCPDRIDESGLACAFVNSVVEALTGPSVTAATEVTSTTESQTSSFDSSPSGTPVINNSDITFSTAPPTSSPSSEIVHTPLFLASADVSTTLAWTFSDSSPIDVSPELLSNATSTPNPKTTLVRQPWTDPSLFTLSPKSNTNSVSTASQPTSSTVGLTNTSPERMISNTPTNKIYRTTEQPRLSTLQPPSIMAITGEATTASQHLTTSSRTSTQSSVIRPTEATPIQPNAYPPTTQLPILHFVETSAYTATHRATPTPLITLPVRDTTIFVPTSTLAPLLPGTGIQECGDWSNLARPPAWLAKIMGQGHFLCYAVVLDISDNTGWALSPAFCGYYLKAKDLYVTVESTNTTKFRVMAKHTYTNNATSGTEFPIGFSLLEFDLKSQGNGSNMGSVTDSQPGMCLPKSTSFSQLIRCNLLGMHLLDNDEQKYTTIVTPTEFIDNSECRQRYPYMTSYLAQLNVTDADVACIKPNSCLTANTASVIVCQKENDSTHYELAGFVVHGADCNLGQTSWPAIAQILNNATDDWISSVLLHTISSPLPKERICGRHKGLNFPWFLLFHFQQQDTYCLSVLTNSTIYPMVTSRHCLSTCLTSAALKDGCTFRRPTLSQTIRTRENVLSQDPRASLPDFSGYVEMPICISDQTRDRVTRLSTAGTPWYRCYVVYLEDVTRNALQFVPIDILPIDDCSGVLLTGVRNGTSTLCAASMSGNPLTCSTWTEPSIVQCQASEGSDWQLLGISSVCNSDSTDRWPFRLL